MQHGLKVANYPLVAEDFHRMRLPQALIPLKAKLFGLTIAPERLAEIRTQRYPNSDYATLANCRTEVIAAERLMLQYGIRWSSTTTKSIEEIATSVLQEIQSDRLEY
jgi:regulator of PEP synthase PpsR (kinase-PPPase family)